MVTQNDLQPLTPVEVRLHSLMGMAYSGNRIGTWGYSGTSRQLFFSSVVHEEELAKFFIIGGCSEYAFGPASELDVPFLMSDKIGMIWLGEYATLGGGGRMLIIMGPMFYASTSQEYVENLLRKMVFDGEITSSELTSYRMVLRDVPIVSSQTVISYAKMLHFTITSKMIGPGDVHYQTEKIQEESEPPTPEKRSWVDYSLVQTQEQIFLQCVREGNLNYMDVLNDLNYGALDMPLSGNPIRSELYKLVSNAALCSRAAIEGGLSPRIARDLEIQYLRKADKLHTVTALRELNLQVLDDFIHHVHDARKQADRSRQIQESCEFISTHLTEDLSIQRIAKEVGYTEYYLTRKFQKEMGIRLTDYIKEARLEYAKVCLLSTELSVEEISDLLQFSSRNYFTRVFREKTGRTPSEFRAGPVASA